MWAVVLLLAVATALWLYRVWRYNVRLRYRTDWELVLHNCSALNLEGPELTYYYCDFRKGIRDYTFDREGVIMGWSDLGAHDVQYSPTQVAEWALIQYENFLRSGNLAHLQDFRKQLRWLIRNSRPVGEDKVVWYFHYDTPEEKAPWASGIAQGIAISALLRGYCCEGDERLLVLARRAFNLLDTPVEDGGFRFSSEAIDSWYEEDSQCSHILNGHIFALLGVYDLFRVTGEVRYHECFERGLAAIQKNMYHFDLGFFTKYCYIDPQPANNSYHRIHAVLLRILHQITGDAWYDTMATRFENYLRGPWFKILNFAYIVRLAIIGRFGGGATRLTGR